MSEPYDDWKQGELNLKRAEQEFERGDKSMLLYAIKLSAIYEIPLPPWAAEAFLHAHFRISECLDLSWDEVFGVPHPKNARRQEAADISKAYRVRSRVRELRKQKPRRDVFPEVAAEFKISVALARKYFYDLEKVEKDWAAKKARTV